ncbi:MAG: hypothetical protein ACPGWR_27375 [Ardenticatenaceae bacterium]
MNWLEVVYQPTTLFSLKPSWATSTGGKSLLLPTPYALKMGLLDAAIRTSGLPVGQAAWSWLRQLEIGIDLPPQIVVTNLFAKILRVKEIKSKASEKPKAIAKAKAQGQWPFQKTIGYREYVYYPAPIRLALGLAESHYEPQLVDWLMQINYLGKRGGFVQLMGQPTRLEDDEGFVRLTEAQDEIPTRGLIQQLDDCGPKMSFAHVNIYNKKRPKRVVRHVVLPYRLVKSSKSYSLYERTDS